MNATSSEHIRNLYLEIRRMETQAKRTAFQETRLRIIKRLLRRRLRES